MLGWGFTSLFCQTMRKAYAPPPAITASNASKPAMIVVGGQEPQQALTIYDSGDPTPEEQYILELINRARAYPDSEGIRLSTTTDPDVSFSYQYFGSPTRQKVKDDFLTYSAQPPLAFNKSLITAARKHSQDMLDHNYQGHTGSDGSTVVDRTKSAGYNGSYVGENVYAYGKSLWHTHASFQIDFGNDATLGHRLNIMNFDPSGPFYTEIGIGTIEGGSGAPDVGPMITTEDFGNNAKTFILGVVYDDQNHNGFYDVGEGLSGVTITCSSGTYSAVTSTSGGYAIPFSDNATVTVTAEGGGLAGPISHQIDFSDHNMKVDFIKDYSGLPVQTLLVAPISDTVLHSDTAYFSWNTVTGATKYRIQVATDPQMKKLVLNDSSLTVTTKKLAEKDTTTYYWHVQARNAKGWGQYSTIASFSVGLPLKPIVLVSPTNGANIGDSDMTFLWRSSEKVAFDYWFEIATDSSFATTIVTDTVYGDTSQYIFASQLVPSTKYYWRVRAENENGWSAPSAVWRFATITESVRSTDGQARYVSVYPNPSNGKFTLTVADGLSNIRVKIYNELGSELSGSTVAVENHGSEIQLDGSNLSAGLYFIQVTAAGFMRTVPVQIVK
jgi:hypothetical protein